MTATLSKTKKNELVQNHNSKNSSSQKAIVDNRSTVIQQKKFHQISLFELIPMVVNQNYSL